MRRRSVNKLMTAKDWAIIALAYVAAIAVLMVLYAVGLHPGLWYSLAAAGFLSMLPTLLTRERAKSLPSPS